MIKAVLFDWGGVLSTGGARGSFRQTFADHFGIHLDEVKISGSDASDDVGGQYARGLISTDQFFQEVNARHSTYSPISDDDFLASDIQKLAREKSEPVFRLAKALRQHGVKTGIVSNIQKVSADKLHEIGNYNDFNPLILSCEVGVAKPESKFYEITVKKTDAIPEEIIFVDDKEECLVPAKKIGMKTVLAISPEQIVVDVKKIILEENDLKI